MRRVVPAVRRIAFLLLLAACGSRTGLFIDDDGFTNVPVPDGGGIGHRPPIKDAEADQDAELPPIDARPPFDANRSDCPDAAATLIYTITDTNDLQSFNPETGTFRSIGKISCAGAGSATPFSMAVNRRGTAYIVFSDGHLFRVSTANAACSSTGFTPNQSGFGTFGMGFATNSIGPTETLYVAGDGQFGSASGLARIDPTTFVLSTVGGFNPTIEAAELTGTGDGRLFAFYSKNGGSPPSFIGQIDTDTAAVIGEKRFDQVDQGNGWAFAYWGGDFYMFHAPGGSTVVTRWRPSDDSVVDVASTSLNVVGAGVSTCAPQ
jgi:hypothetical protein